MAAQLKRGWGNFSVMGTCCVYDEFWPICLLLEGKHVWHLVMTLSILLGCLFFWQRWISLLFLVSSYRMMLVNKVSLLGQSMFTFTCFTGTVTVCLITRKAMRCFHPPSQEYRLNLIKDFILNAKESNKRIKSINFKWSFQMFDWFFFRNCVIFPSFPFFCPPKKSCHCNFVA